MAKVRVASECLSRLPCPAPPRPAEPWGVQPWSAPRPSLTFPSPNHPPTPKHLTQSSAKKSSGKKGKKGISGYQLYLKGMCGCVYVSGPSLLPSE